MKKAILPILLFLAAFNAGATVSLRDLDEALKDTSYEEAKKQTIASKKALAAQAAASEDPELYFRRLSEIRDEYAFYQIDSAVSYSLKAMDVARKTGCGDNLALSCMYLAEGYIQQGMYVEARDLLESMDVKDSADSVRASFFHLSSSLYEALEANTEDFDLKYEYRQKGYAYKDSLIAISPENVLVRSMLYSASKQDERAFKLLMDRFNSISIEEREIGQLAYAIAQYYKNSGERQEEKKYLIISAISDIKHSLKAYISLRRLSEILYDEGDYFRAHKYIVRCMDDAVFGGARLRIVQISSILPLLSATFQKKLSTRLMIVSISGVIILILTVVLVFLLRQKHRQQKEIDKANRLLSESGAIKNVYIFNLLMEEVKRIETLDKYRKQIKRKAFDGDREDLLKELKSTNMIDNQWRAFYQSFDQTFLEIFPLFIQEVNKLMTPGNEFEAGALNVELRILALIRLGIEETDRIASVLNYSKATVYSYRSRIRLRARDPRQFEEKIKEIRSI